MEPRKIKTWQEVQLAVKMHQKNMINKQIRDLISKKMKENAIKYERVALGLDKRPAHLIV